jgi:hypothetical protein
MGYAGRRLESEVIKVHVAGGVIWGGRKRGEEESEV